jgi:uncharacterized membrane protein
MLGWPCLADIAWLGQSDWGLFIFTKPLFYFYVLVFFSKRTREKERRKKKGIYRTFISQEKMKHIITYNFQIYFVEIYWYNI